MSTKPNPHPGTEDDVRYKELRELNNKLFAKIGEIESVIKVNKADGKDTAEEKQKVNKLVTKVSEVADELSSIKSEHVKRMDELERELQEETQKKFKFDSTNVSLPGDTMMDLSLIHI